MKRLLSAALAAALVFSLAGCQKQPPADSGSSGSQPGSGSAVQTPPDTSGQGSDWRPNGQIELVVPFGAGGSSDLSARALVPYLQEELGCSIYVNNMSGAGGLTGTSYALNKKADGYTLVWNSTRCVSPEIYQSDPPYTTEDLQAVAELTETFSVIAASKDSPFDTLEDFVQYAKENPGVKYAHTGRGYKNHLTALTLDSLYELGMTEVPYSGDADACTAVLRGDVSVGFISLTSAFTQYEAGNMKILAVCNGTRNDKIPDVPTLGETEYPVDDIVSYIGLFCARDTPVEIVESLSRAVEKCMENPGLHQDLEAIGQSPTYRNYEEFGALVDKVNGIVGPIWKDAGLLE